MNATKLGCMQGDVREDERALDEPRPLLAAPLPPGRTGLAAPAPRALPPHLPQHLPGRGMAPFLEHAAVAPTTSSWLRITGALPSSNCYRSIRIRACGSRDTTSHEKLGRLHWRPGKLALVPHAGVHQQSQEALTQGRVAWVEVKVMAACYCCR